MQDLAGRDGLAGTIALQIDIQGAIRKLALHLVRPRHRQRGLAHPWKAVHRSDPDGTRDGPVMRCGQQCVESSHVLDTADEVSDAWRQLPGHLRLHRQCGAGQRYLLDRASLHHRTCHCTAGLVPDIQIVGHMGKCVDKRCCSTTPDQPTWPKRPSRPWSPR
ncbi:MAG TPA: hypothetical protein VGR06_17585 [Actinophytocola sp.]|nr:hypothetical protein [Actinophytocola sp.]